MSISLKDHHTRHFPQPKMEQTLNKDSILKATELRLGLPGSDSPERTNVNGVTGAGTAVMNLVTGAKRGFSDTWVFSGNGGSEVDFVKNGAFFSSSPRGENKNPNSGKEDFVSDSSKRSLIEKHTPLKGQDSVAASKAQVVGWPPIRSFRKNSMAANHTKNEDDQNANLGSRCFYVKVSMDGAPYLRKVDLKMYSSYLDLSSALEKMFSCFTIGQYGEGLTESRLMDLLHGSEYILTYEDKDGDWMLVGDVPWDMFTGSCKRMRIMKSSDAIGLAPRAMERCKDRN